MANRWWIYQQERFPIFKHGALIAVFAVSAVCYSALLRKAAILLVGPMLVAFITLFLFFLQLRIADEFKDYKDDLQYRPYRPVSRGLVSLSELGRVAIAAAAIQFGLAFSVGLPLVFLLLLVWGYMALMSREFFVPQWLKAHPLVYMLSHAVIMPLMAFYATACDWVTVGAVPRSSLVWFCVMSLFNGLAIEIGRKIRAPQDEEKGVETYTALWGKQRAVLAWLSVTWLMAIAALIASTQIQFITAIALALMPLLTLALIISWRFLSYPVPKWAKSFELTTGIWTLLVYLSVSIIPVAFRLS